MTTPRQRLEIAPSQDVPDAPTPILARVIVWRDLRFTLVWGGKPWDAETPLSSETWMNFALYPIWSFTDGEDPIYDEVPRHTTNVAEAEPAFHGAIKWDGCMQWRSGDFLFHADERDDLERLEEALQRVRDLMHVMNPECAGRPHAWSEPR